MLRQTFCHIQGFGPQSERWLWNGGIGSKWAILSFTVLVFVLISYRHETFGVLPVTTDIYFTHPDFPEDDRIRRINASGATLVQDLVVGEMGVPRGIAVDHVAAKIYWADVNLARIQRANLDGTDVENVVAGLAGPHYLALDIDAGKMYWTDLVQRPQSSGPR